MSLRSRALRILNHRYRGVLQKQVSRALLRGRAPNGIRATSGFDIPQPNLESLEPRLLLSGSADVFAHFEGEVTDPASPAQITITVSPDDFTQIGDSSVLSFRVSSPDGSDLDPARIWARRSDNRLIDSVRSVDDLPGVSDSLTIANFEPATYTLMIQGESGTTGRFLLDVGLVGDTNGDRVVDEADRSAVIGAFGRRSGDAEYLDAADANQDGRITSFDFAQVLRNQGDSTVLNPLSLMASFDPSPPAVLPGGGFITNNPVTALNGTAAIGSGITLDLDGDGFDDGFATPDALGEFSFPGTLADGMNTWRLRATDSFGQVQVVAIDVTLDTDAPEVLSAPTGTLTTTFSSFDVLFTEDMSPNAFDPAGYGLTVVGGDNDGQVIPIASVDRVDGTTARINLTEVLPDQSYGLSINPSLSDLAGNALQTTADFAFTVADPTGIEELSPTNGETLVRLKRELVAYFDEPIDPATVTDETFHAIANGQRVPGTIRVSSDDSTARLFLDELMPASTRFRLVIDGDQIMGRDGFALDADGDNTPGGVRNIEFTTVSDTRIQGTNVTGSIFDAFRTNPDGSNIPVVGAKLTVEGSPDIFAVTDENGFFRLEDVPSPEFFVDINGKTATNAPDGFFFGRVTKPFHSVPGQEVVLAKNGAPFDVFLPLLEVAAVIPIVEDQETIATFSDESLRLLGEFTPDVPREMWEQLRVEVPPNSLFHDDGSAATGLRVFPLPKDRIPVPLPAGVDPAIVFSVEAGGAENVDVPARIVYPNADGLAPGEKRFIYSFDHDAGEWRATGVMTVSDDGSILVSDRGVQTLGWRFIGGESGSNGKGGRGHSMPDPSPMDTRNENEAAQLITGELGVFGIPVFRALKDRFRKVHIEIEGPLSDFMERVPGGLSIETNHEFILMPGAPEEKLFATSAMPTDEMFKFLGHFCGGIKSLDTNVLFGSRITVTDVTWEDGGPMHTEATSYYLYRFIDATDSQHNDKTIEFEAALNDGLGGVARNKPIEFRTGATPIPSVRDIEPSSNQNYSVALRSGGVNVTFDPVFSTGSDSSSIAGELVVTTPSGLDVSQRIGLKGEATEPQGIFIDSEGFMRLLANIASRQPIANVDSAAISDDEIEFFDSDDKRRLLAQEIEDLVLSHYSDFGLGIKRAASRDSPNTIVVNFTTTLSGNLGTVQKDPNQIDKLQEIARAVEQRGEYSETVQNFILDKAINQFFNAAVEIYPDQALEKPYGSFLSDLPRAVFINQMADTISHEIGHTLGLIHSAKGRASFGNSFLDLMATPVNGSGIRTFLPGITAPALNMALNLEWSRDAGQTALNYYVKSLGFEAIPEFSIGDDVGLGIPERLINGAHLVLASEATERLVGNSQLFGQVASDGQGGDRALLEILLRNIGGEDLIIQDISISDTEHFSLIDTLESNTIVLPGDEVRIEISFDPLEVGQAFGRLIIESNTSPTPLEVLMSGFGTSLTPSALLEVRNNNVGGVALGHQAVERPRIATITNGGTEPLIISDIRIVEGAANFELSGLPTTFPESAVELGFGESITFNTSFEPVQVGLQRGLIEIVTNDPSQPVLEMSIVGTGVNEIVVPGDGRDVVAIETFQASGSNDGALTQRTISNSAGAYSFILPAQREYHLRQFNPETGLIAHGYGTTAPSGADLSLTDTLVFGASTSPDSDFDGLPDDIEFAIGTSITSADTDGDGLDDFTEIDLGLNAVDGIGFPTGIIASLPLQGQANEVVVEGATDGSVDLTAYVATGSHGLAIVDVSRFDSPVVLGQLDLAGTAMDVAIDGQLNIAVVAGSGGLHFVDVSDPLLPQTLNRVLVFASQVEVVDGLAYAAVGSQLRVYDVLTGEGLQTLVPDGSVINGIAREGSKLYAVTSNQRLQVIDIDGFGADLEGQADLSDPAHGVFVGNGVAYVANGIQNINIEIPNPRLRGGYSTVDVSDPDNPQVISGIMTPEVQAGNFKTVTNGSGLALVAAGFRGLELHDARHTNDTYEFITAIPTPWSAQSVAVAGGIAFVADGAGGLQVINYRSFDDQGNPPDVSVNIPVVDEDPDADGIQVPTGKSVPVTVEIQDDVQVRNVELLVNGEVVQNVVSFPFNFAPIARGAEADPAEATIQVRATDTGGNVGLSDVLILDLTPDDQRPTLESVTPTAGSVIAEGPLAIKLSFSEPLDPATANPAVFKLTDSMGVEILPQAIQLRADDRFVQLSFASLVPDQYELTIDAMAVTDRAGNRLGDGPVIHAFTVDPLVVLNTTSLDVDPDKPGIQVESRTEVEFTASLFPGAPISTSAFVYVNDKFDGFADRSFNDEAFNFSRTVVNNGSDSRFLSYELQTSATGVGTFRTDPLVIEVLEDTTPPVVDRISPPSGTLRREGSISMSVRFSEDLGINSVLPSMFTLQSTEGQVIEASFTAFWIDEVDLTFDGVSAGEYELVIAPSVIDEAGNSVVQDVKPTYTFTPRADLGAAAADEDLAAPGIQVSGGSEVPILVGNMLGAGIDFDKIELLQDGEVIETIETVDVLPFEIVVPLTNPMAGVRDVVLEARVTDTAGFATITPPLVIDVLPDTVAPMFLDSEPGDGESLVTFPQPIRLRFTEPMDLSTFDASSVLLRHESGQTIGLEGVLGDDFNRTVLLDFGQVLEGNHELVLEADLIKDTAGIPVGGGQINRSFTIEPSPVFVGPTYQVGGEPLALISQDLNGDGISDAVTADGDAGTISVLLGSVLGRFDAAVSYPVGAASTGSSLAAALIDADDVTDLLVSTSDGASLLLGNDDGTFAEAMVIDTNGLFTSFVIGDFSNDSLIDVVGLRPDGTVVLLAGNGDGTFSHPSDIMTLVGSDFLPLVAGNIDGLGGDDLVTSNELGQVLTLISQSTGGFAPPTITDTGMVLTRLATGRVNQDGRTDILAVGTDSRLGILLANNDGSFVVSHEPTSITHSSLLHAQDIDGDGHLDVLVTADGSGKGELLHGTGDGGFNRRVSVDLAGVPGALGATDITGDGLIDLLVASGADGVGRVAVLEANGVGSFDSPHADLAIGDSPTQVFAADFDGDHAPDLLVQDAIGVSIRLSTGNGTFGSPAPLGIDTFIVSVQDFDGDGDIDVLGDGQIVLNNGDGTFADPLGAPGEVAAVGDLNQDGLPDLATAPSGFAAYLNQGGGVFGPRVNFGYASPVFGDTLILADLDGDDDLDALGQRMGDFRFDGDYVWLNNGNGQLIGDFFGGAHSLSQQTLGDLSEALVSDVTGDGRDDLVFVEGSSIRVIPAEGDAQLSGAIVSAMGAGFSGGGRTTHQLVDTNNDGSLDVIATNLSTDTVSVALGTGDGRFVRRQDFATGEEPLGLAVADVTGDGRVDLVTANRGADSISVVYQDTPPQRLLAIDPPDGYFVTTADPTIQFRFAEPLDATLFDADTVQIFDPNGLPVVPDSLSLANGQRAIEVTFSGLAAGNYQIVIDPNEIANLAGSPIGGPAVESGLTVDLSPSAVHSVSPGDGAQVDSALTSLTFALRQPVDPATVSDQSVLLRDAFGQSIPTAINVLDDQQTVELTFSPLGDGDYSLSVDPAIIFSPVGQSLGDELFESGFIVEAQAPSLTRQFPATYQAVSGRLNTARLTFSERLDPGTVLGANFSIRDASENEVTPNSVRLLDHDRLVELDFEEIAAGDYELVIRNTVTDRFGNGVDPDFLTTPFFVVEGTADLFAGRLFFGESRSIKTVDLNDDGLMDLVSTFSPETNHQDSVSIQLALVGGGFGATQSIAVGDGADSMALGLLNGDRQPDIAVVNRYSDTVTVLLSDPEGNYATPQTIPVGREPRSLAIGDATGDGHQDLIVANAFDGTISILAGDGNGGFAFYEDLSAGQEPVAVAFDDVSGDTINDLVVADRMSDQVLVFHGLGGGGYDVPRHLITGPRPESLLLTDLNNNGIVDLVVVSNEVNFASQSSLVEVFFEPGTGPLVADFTFDSFDRAVGQIQQIDADGDANLDLAIQILGPDNKTLAYYLVANGGGSNDFTLQPIQFDLDRASIGATLMDVDRTNGLDIVSVDRFDADVSVQLNSGSEPLPGLANEGDGQFTPDQVANRVLLGQFIGDFNNDGRPDVAQLLADQPGTVSVLLGGGGSQFEDRIRVDVGGRPSSLRIADLNNDGFDDLVAVNPSDDSVSVVTGEADGHFASPQVLSVGRTPIAVRLADVNDDTFLDIVTANQDDGTVSLLLSAGPDTYSPAQSLAVSPGISDVVVGDVNNDTWLDLVVTNPVTGELSVFEANAPGDFDTATTSTIEVELFPEFTTMLSLSRLDLLDATGDGVLDLVADEESEFSRIVVLEGDNTGSFQFARTIGGSSLFFTSLGDLDHDGALDMVTINSSTSAVKVTKDVFGMPSVLQLAGTSIEAYVTSLADFDRNGSLDVLVADRDGRLMLLVNLGDGQLPTGRPELDFFSQPMVGDVNGDGFDDLVSFSDGINVDLGQEDGSLKSVGFISPTGSITSAVLADTDTDGRLEIVTTVNHTSTRQVLIYDVSEDGTIAAPFHIDLDPDTVVMGSIAAGDVDNDGYLDLAVANGDVLFSGTHRVTVLLGSRDGTFTELSPIEFLDRVDLLSIEEIGSDDAVPDLVVTTRRFSGGNSQILVLPGLGNGVFQSPEAFDVESNVEDLVFGDLNNDGWSDIVFTRSDSDQGSSISVMLGNRSGGFTSPADYRVGRDPRQLDLGDLDGDGVLDVITANAGGFLKSRTGDGDLTVLLGTGDGSFNRRSDYRLENGVDLPLRGATTSVALMDLGDDGTLDVIADAAVMWILRNVAVIPK